MSRAIEKVYSFGFVLKSISWLLIGYILFVLLYYIKLYI